MGTLLCDVDGVLADIDAPVKAIMGKHFRADLWDWGQVFAPAEIGEAVDAAMNAPGFCNALEAYPGAVDFIKAVNRKHDVVFVTSPNSTGPTWMWERTCWLKERFPDLPVIHTRFKQYTFGDWLLDDKAENAKAWGARFGSCNADVNKAALLMDRPYNRAGVVEGYHIKRVFGYDHVRQILGCL